MSTQQEEREKRFDEKVWAEELPLSYKRVIKSFVNAEVNLAVAQREKEIVEILQNICNMCSGDLPEHEDIWRFAHNKLSLITKPNDK